MNQTKITLHRAAIELNVSRETLRRQLIASGTEHEGPFTLAELVAARMPTDERAAKARLTAADAELREHELAELKRELVRMADVERVLVETVVLPLRQWLVSLLTTFDVRCNSEKPEIARATLIQARDECLGLLREKLPTP